MGCGSLPVYCRSAPPGSILPYKRATAARKRIRDTHFRIFRISESRATHVAKIVER
jgi:hypothetical protein